MAPYVELERLFNAFKDLDVLKVYEADIEYGYQVKRAWDCYTLPMPQLR